MKTSTIVFTGIMLLTMNIAILPGALQAKEEPDINRGAKAWANTCSRCHNMRQPSEFTDDVWEPTINHMRVRAGIPGDMARDIRAFLQSSNFSSPKIAASTRSSDTLSTSNEITAQTGKAVFDKTCIACHVADGKGTIPGIPALQSRLSQSDGVLLQNIKDGKQSPGSSMMMPPRGGNPNLSDADLRSVLLYMRQQFGH